jgi:MFS family permease
MGMGQVVSAPVVGYLGDRYGNRVSLLTAAGALLGATICALLARTLEWFYLVFVLLGVNLGSELMARYNIAVEFAPEHRRATYFGLMNAMLAPFYAASLLGGWFSDLFGYRTVFLMGSLCSVTGILLLLVVVREPRAATNTLKAM